MIIWQGFGILSFIIPFITVGTVYFGGKAAFGLDDWAVVQPLIGLSILLSAAIVWKVGKRLNSKPGRLLVDPATNQRVMLKSRHTLFWIPMEWIAVPIAFSSLYVFLAPG